LKRVVDSEVDKDLTNVGVPPKPSVVPTDVSEKKSSTKQSSSQSSNVEVPTEEPTAKIIGHLSPKAKSESRSTDSVADTGSAMNESAPDLVAVAESPISEQVDESKLADLEEDSAKEPSSSGPSEVTNLEPVSGPEPAEDPLLPESPVSESTEIVESPDPEPNSLVQTPEVPQEADSSEKEPLEDGIQEHVVSDSLTSAPTEEEKKEQAAVKHLAKTKKGLIKKISKNDGSMSLRDLHSFSEARYFVGHKRFSDLMEEMIAEELVSYEYEDGIVFLGAKAHTLLS
jgi:hypothetical protein